MFKVQQACCRPARSQELFVRVGLAALLLDNQHHRQLRHLLLALRVGLLLLWLDLGGVVGVCLRWAGLALLVARKGSASDQLEIDQGLGASLAIRRWRWE